MKSRTLSFLLTSLKELDEAARTIDMRFLAAIRVFNIDHDYDALCARWEEAMQKRRVL